VGKKVKKVPLGCEIILHVRADASKPRKTDVTSGGLKLQCIAIDTFYSFACIQALNYSATCSHLL